MFEFLSEYVPTWAVFGILLPLITIWATSRYVIGKRQVRHLFKSYDLKEDEKGS